MRLLYVVTTPRPFFRAQVKALESEGHSIHTITVPGRKTQSDRRNHLDYLKFYMSILKSVQSSYDIIHANYGLTAPFALGQPQRPIILTLWGSDLMGRYSRLTQTCARFCDEVIVMSPEMADELDMDVHVIPHGIDLDLFRPKDQETAQQQVGWDPSRHHVLFPYHPERDVKNYSLAKSIIDLVNERLDIRVELHAVYGLDHDRIPLYMNAAEAMLLTSHREGSPNSVKEAMACNLPVVSTDVGDVDERLSDVRYSFVCQDDRELFDRLIEVLKMGKRSNGREHVEDLRLDRMGKQILDVYERALG